MSQGEDAKIASGESDCGTNCTLYSLLVNSTPFFGRFCSSFLWHEFRNEAIRKEIGLGAIGEPAVRIRYTFKRLSKEEKDLFQAILLEEMEIQRWFTVAYTSEGEIFLVLQ
jgi:hypothetical protein